MSYNKEMCESLDKIITNASEHADAGTIDIRNADDAFKIKAMASLIRALETCLKITKARHYQAEPAPEPFPGACAAVIDQSLMGIELARKAGLIQ